MAVDYEILVKGNNLRLAEGFLGFANLTLIRTDDGPMVFDVGHAGNRQALVNALERQGLRPADVPRVFLSHLHFDHVNNIDLFPTTTKVFVSRAEWQYAASPHEDDAWIPWMVREQLDKYDVTLLDGGGEFQPGIRYVPAPGHTPGSYALVLDTAEKGRVVVAGDAVKFPKEALQCRCDHAFGSAEEGAETIKNLLTLGDRVVPGHFSELIRRDGTYVWDEPCELHLLIR